MIGSIIELSALCEASFTGYMLSLKGFRNS